MARTLVLVILSTVVCGYLKWCKSTRSVSERRRPIPLFGLIRVTSSLESRTAFCWWRQCRICSIRSSRNCSRGSGRGFKSERRSRYCWSWYVCDPSHVCWEHDWYADTITIRRASRPSNSKYDQRPRPCGSWSAVLTLEVQRPRVIVLVPPSW